MLATPCTVRPCLQLFWQFSPWLIGRSTARVAATLLPHATQLGPVWQICCGAVWAPHSVCIPTHALAAFSGAC